MQEETQVYLYYNGDSRHPERRGVIPNVTPRTDDGPGLAPGEGVKITDQLLAGMNRATGPQARSDFAEFIAGVYNANRSEPRWEVLYGPLHIVAPLTDISVAYLQSPGTDPGFVARDVFAIPPLPGPKDVQSEDEPDEQAEGSDAVSESASESAPSAKEEETQ